MKKTQRFFRVDRFNAEKLADYYRFEMRHGLESLRYHFEKGDVNSQLNWLRWTISDACEAQHWYEKLGFEDRAKKMFLVGSYLQRRLNALKGGAL